MTNKDARLAAIIADLATSIDEDRFTESAADDLLAELDTIKSRAADATMTLIHTLIDHL